MQGGNCPATRYDPFPPNIVKSYQTLNKTLSGRVDLAFFHIPLPEYSGVLPIVGSNNLFDAILLSGSVPKPWCYVPWLVKLLGQHRIAGEVSL